MFAADILKVFYAPHKVFKQIVQNPKYWGPLLILVIFIATQSAFYYSANLKTYYEQTSPELNRVTAWTEDPKLWTVSQGVAVSSNYLDFINSTFYGNSSLQFQVANSNSISMQITSFSNVDCSNTGYQNLSLRIKQVEPTQATPVNAILTLYSLSQSNSFQRSLTSELSNNSQIGMWNNITVPVGANVDGWQANGNPQWQNITGLKLELNFADNSSITVRLQGLFFRGIYQTYTQMSVAGFIVNVLQLAVSQFLFQWLIFSGLLYVIIKGLKGNVTWKPLFIAVGFALAVTIVQSLANVAATAVLPTVYYPVEWFARTPIEYEQVSSAIAAQTQTFTLAAGVIQLVTYGWLIALGAFIVKAIQPEFTWTKAILGSAAAFIVTIIILSLLGV